MRGWLPLGQRVYIRSPLQADVARVALRNAMKKRVRDPDALVGFAIGPILYAQSGWFGSPPAVLALLKRRNTGVEIIGNAGLNIAAVLVLGSAATIATLIGAIDLAVSGGAGLFALSLVALVTMYGLGWLNHIFRKDADPLVHVLRRAVRASELERDDRNFDRTPMPGATLIVDGEDRAVSPSQYDVREALLELSEYQFVIVAFGDEIYMQSLKEGGAYQLEERRGSSQQHYRAEPNVDADTVVRVMTAYLKDRKSSHDVVWKQVHP